MNKSAAGFCKRLYSSIEEKFGAERAEEVCGGGVSQAASAEDKGRWAAESMGRLEAAFGETERAGILAGCACGPRPAQLESMGKKYRGLSLEDFADRRTADMKGAVRYEARDGLLYVSYPQCYCPMIKNSPVPVSRTWCLCSCEYTRRACEAALGSPAEVKLLKSSIAGDDECLFEVRVR